MPEPAQQFHIFIVYAREDAEALRALKRKLAVLEHGDLVVWYDAEISPGQDWDAQIKLNLKNADIVLLLLSDDFFASRYIRDTELREALEREKQGEATVIPVILYDCLWDEHPELARLQVLPEGAKPVYDWEDAAKAFTNAARGIAAAIKKPDTAARRARKHERQAREAADIQRAEQEHQKAAERQLREEELRRQKAEAEQRRREAAERLKYEPDMALIPGGTFRMGSEEGDKEALDREKPAHDVTVPAFWLAKYQTTVAQFRTFIEETGYQTDAEKEGTSWGYDKKDTWTEIKGRNWRHDPEGNPAQDKHPVINVSWNDAQAYCTWLSAKTGQKYRLPSEAEWEYAAGNGARHTRYSWGNGAPLGKRGGNVADETAKKRFPSWTIFEGYADGFVFTAPVGSFEPNDFGLCDMTGNVWEWCEDWYHDSYKGAPADGSAWLSPAGSGRVRRGGSWNVYPQGCRVAYRGNGAPGYRSYSTGFRLARTN